MLWHDDARVEKELQLATRLTVGWYDKRFVWALFCVPTGGIGQTGRVQRGGLRGLGGFTCRGPLPTRLAAAQASQEGKSEPRPFFFVR